jgi:hypothetical protein
MRAHLGKTALVLVVSAVHAIAGPPEIDTIVERMKSALEPVKPSIRRLTFRASGDGPPAPITVGEARKRVGRSSRHLLVVLAPEVLRGTAGLMYEGGEADDLQWIYSPVIRRVRTIVSPEAYTSFLNSDFTYADLGFVAMRATYALLGEEEIDGEKAWKVEGVPRDRWYYGRTVTWVNQRSGLPHKREFYTPANVLWKVERWDRISTVQGVPTAMRRTMEDVLHKTRTEIDVSSVNYEVWLPDELFDPHELPSAVGHEVWSRLGG